MRAEDYVDQLIETEREGMNQRAEWISEHRPQYSHGMSMFGGEKALALYEDSQLSYIYGTFSGSIPTVAARPTLCLWVILDTYRTPQ
jgi:hypothetical protein